MPKLAIHSYNKSLLSETQTHTHATEGYSDLETKLVQLAHSVKINLFKERGVKPLLPRLLRCKGTRGGGGQMLILAGNADIG
jgi:hypothetical protein